MTFCIRLTIYMPMQFPMNQSLWKGPDQKDCGNNGCVIRVEKKNNRTLYFSRKAAPYQLESIQDSNFSSFNQPEYKFDL